MGTEEKDFADFIVASKCIEQAIWGIKSAKDFQFDYLTLFEMTPLLQKNDIKNISIRDVSCLVRIYHADTIVTQ